MMADTPPPNALNLGWQSQLEGTHFADPVLLMLASAQAAGLDIGISSGLRTRQEQQALYNQLGQYDAQTNPNGAALPGTSNHETGWAVDLDLGPQGSAERAANIAWLEANAANFGLHFPVSGEPWHVEPIDREAVSGFDVQQLGLTPTDYSTMTDEEIVAEVQETYGPGVGAWLDHPEVGPIWIDALREGWEPEEIQGQLSQTEWWRGTSGNARQWDQLVLEDPASANRQIRQETLSLQNYASRLGLTLSDAELADIASRKLRLGLSDEEAALLLVAGVGDDASDFEGNLAMSAGDLRNMASRDYMLKVSESEIATWTQKLFTGEWDENNIRDVLTRRAQAKYPYLQDFLDQGITPGNVFSEHRAEVADLLGVDVDTVDLVNDPILRRILQPTSEGLMPTIDDAKRITRNSWAFQNNSNRAVEEASSLVTRIGQVWGMR